MNSETGLKRRDGGRKERMESLYYKVIWAVLLFPWSLVGLIALGALRQRKKAHARVEGRP